MYQSIERSLSVDRVSRLLSLLAILSASVAATVLLFPDPLADVFFAGWVLFSVGLTIVGGFAAWTSRTPLIWVTSILLLIVSILGMMSIGFLIAPAALFLLGAALFSQVAGPREGVQEAIIADPPTTTQMVLKTLGGVVSVALGAGLVYSGAFVQTLFGACIQETLACALSKTHWDTVGLTVAGLVIISLGGWLIWKQLYIARVLL